jgi:AraC-like DNA-binding protein
MHHPPLFFYTERSAPLRVSTSLIVHSLGIWETMPAGAIRRQNPDYPYLFMHLHDDAVVDLGSGELLPAGGQTIVWGPGVALHHYGSDERTWCHSWLMVDGRCAGDALESNRVPLNRLLDIGAEDIMVKYLRAIYDELHSHAPPDPFILESIVHIWVRELARALQRGNAPSVAPHRLTAARQYMESHLDKPVRLDELARQASLSVSRFSELFRRHYGMPPVHYLNELRMKRAALLLGDQNLAAYQVASMVGFEDPLYFSKAFGKRWGVTVREYRRRVRGR